TTFRFTALVLSRSARQSGDRDSLDGVDSFPFVRLQLDDIAAERFQVGRTVIAFAVRGRARDGVRQAPGCQTTTFDQMAEHGLFLHFGELEAGSDPFDARVSAM